MSRPRTWKVVDWSSRPPGIPDGEPLSLDCPCCEREAWMPTAGRPGSAVIGTNGMRVFFDQADNIPPPYWMPFEVQCRGCRRIFGRG